MEKDQAFKTLNFLAVSMSILRSSGRHTSLIFPPNTSTSHPWARAAQPSRGGGNCPGSWHRSTSVKIEQNYRIHGTKPVKINKLGHVKIKLNSKNIFSTFKIRSFIYIKLTGKIWFLPFHSQTELFWCQACRPLFPRPCGQLIVRSLSEAWLPVMEVFPLSFCKVSCEWPAAVVSCSLISQPIEPFKTF